ncbi:MAG: VWA domain-containing protein [Gammaproteobacteria bacterium]|nr:VWA domain-containing protein [Gammaproteobacteria bacterium]
MIDHFHFLRPLYLLVAPVGLALCALLWTRFSTVSAWNLVCDAHLLGHLLVGQAPKQSRISILGLACAWVLASLALAGPSWERAPQSLHHTPGGKVLVFDLSRSMDSTDLRPSRLQRARYKIADLVTAAPGIPHGLVVFAGDAFVVTPLTDDSDTLLNLVPNLDTDTVPVQGSRTDLGLRLAESLLVNAGIRHGEIILVADGANPDTGEIARKIASHGHTVSVLATGTPEGAPVVLASGELLKDARGSIVIPAVDLDYLKRISQSGNGRFSTLSSDNRDIDLLTAPRGPVASLDRGPPWLPGNHSDVLHTDRWIDNGFWLILPLLCLCAMSFRRGWVLAVLLVVLPLSPPPAVAMDWDDLWLRADQQYARNLKNGDYDKIPGHAPAGWLGAARYRRGDYPGALEAYSSIEDKDALTYYNHGNALAKNHSLEESLEAYNAALDLDPDFEDARFNKALIETLLSNQEKQDNPGDRSDEPSNPRAHSGNQDPMGRAGSDQPGQSDDGEEPNGREPDAENQEAGLNPFRPDQQNPEKQQIDPGPLAQSDEPARETGEIPMGEEEQALNQWLQRIPDDPGGLLRRKFAYQYSRRPPQPKTNPW